MVERKSFFGPWRAAIFAAAAAVALTSPASLPSGATAQDPTPAPTPAPVVTVDPAPQPVAPFVVKLEGPAGTIDGPFEIAVTKPATAELRWKNKIPEGVRIRELTDNTGQTVLMCLRPLPGAYRFHLLAQLPKDGLDPFAEDEIEFTVGPVTPVVVQPPTTPTTPDAPTIDPESKITAATYVYLKDGSANVPSAVMGALNRLNREKKITATLFEQDTTDGTDDVPEQYKAAVAEAKRVGLPCLVVLAGSKVVRVVKNPTTEAAVMEAVP